MADPVDLAEARRALIARLQKTLINSLNLNLSPVEIAEDAPLFGVGLGLDSIDALQFVVGVEDEFECQLPPEGIHIYRSLNTLADYLSTILAL